MARAAASSPTSTLRRSRSSARRWGAGGSNVRSVPMASRNTATPRIVCSPPMFAADLLREDSSWEDVIVPLVLAAVAVVGLDRVLKRRGRKLRDAVLRGDVT